MLYYCAKVILYHLGGFLISLFNSTKLNMLLQLKHFLLSLNLYKNIAFRSFIIALRRRDSNSHIIKLL